MAERMRVRDVMTLGCKAIDEHKSVLEAAKHMQKFDIGALPICGEDDKLQGLVTDRDIVLEVVCKGLDPATTEVGKLGGKAVVIRSDDDLERAIELMSIQQVRRLPVVDGGDKLVGMISQGDIATHAESRTTGEMVASISEGG